MQIIDISQPITPQTVPWPGDARLDVRWSLELARGASVNLSTLTLSPHVGSHADAPLHVRENARSIGECALDAYIGPARVITVSAGDDGLLGPDVVAGLDLRNTPRLLLKTGTGCDGSYWPASFAALSPAGARAIVAAGVRLVGIDTPSVDPEHASALEAHHVLLEGGLAWLENLDLRAVEPGAYELVALPLRLMGVDASPVRAVLVRR